MQSDRKRIEWTHPEPRRFALAVSAIAAADRGVRSDVEDSTIVFENGVIVRIVPGPLQERYGL